jgi:hypothetical protein
VPGKHPRSSMPSNQPWHARHVMPKRPTLEERLKWHVEHQLHCGCRAIPAKLLEQLPHPAQPSERRPAAKRKRRAVG